MIPTWLITLASGGLGAFVAAWAGAYVGFRRGKKERALDRRIGWHEAAIQGLAHYEESLERLRGHALNVLVVQRTKNRPPNAAPRPEDMPKTVKAPAPLWTELAACENRARAALRLADLYTEGRVRLDCSVALNHSVNMVASQWIDISAEPEIVWTDLQTKSSAAASVRRSLQESLRLILELDGVWATIRGPRYRQKLRLNELDKLKAEINAPAS